MEMIVVPLVILGAISALLLSFSQKNREQKVYAKENTLKITFNEETKEKLLAIIIGSILLIFVLFVITLVAIMLMGGISFAVHKGQ